MLAKRTPFFLAALLALTGCASSPKAPSEEPQLQEPKAADTAEKTASPQRPAARALPFADVEKVLAAFPPERQRFLLEAPRLELLGLICERDPDPGEASLFEDEYPIRSTKLLSETERREALAALYESVATPFMIAFCFEPHHAIRASSPGQEPLVVLMCFGCGQVQLWQDQDMIASAILGSAGEATLNRLLGQKRTIPEAEIAGRSLAFWHEQFQNSPRDSDEYPYAGEQLCGLVGSENPRQRAFARWCFRERFRRAPAEATRALAYALTDDNEIGRTVSARLALAFAAREAEEAELRESMLELGKALIDALESSESPAARRAILTALRAFRWADRETREAWLASLSLEGPEAPRLIEQAKAALAAPRE